MMKHDRIETNDAKTVSPASKVMRAMENAVDRGMREATSKMPNRAERRARAMPNMILGRGYGTKQNELIKSVKRGYAIEGLVPRGASTVWFGESAIGKTMVALWKALSIAAVGPNRPTHWCGQPIRRRGIVIFYSGEDSLMEGRDRLREIASLLIGLKGDELEDTVNRVFFVNPSDLDEDDFSGEDASLFEKENGRWYASGNAEGIRASIQRINEEATRPEDRVAGVIQDSATSVSGFDAMEGEAVSRYFFWVNSICRQNDLFWLVLGHIAQEAKVDPHAPEYRARYRLRGVVVWITAPRLVIEVRVPFGAHNSKPGWNECLEAMQRQVATKPEHLLTVTVVKANVKDACKRKIWLRWSDESILRDVTEDMTGVARSKAQYDEMRKREKIDAAAAGHAPPAEDFSALSEVVLAMINSLYAEKNKAVSKSAAIALQVKWRKDDEQIKEHPVLAKAGTDGGFQSNQGDPRSVTSMFTALEKAGEIVKVTGGYMPAKDVVLVVNDEQELEDQSALLGAILAIAKSMAANEPSEQITDRSIEARARATSWANNFEVLRTIVPKKGQGGEWLDKLVQSEHLVREVAGHYTVVGVKPAIPDVEAPVVIETPAPDLEPVFTAVLAAVAALEKINESEDEDAHNAIVASNVLKKVMSTDFRKEHPVIDDALEDGRLVRTMTVSKKVTAGSAEWYLYELTKVGRAKLVRLADGAYALPSKSAVANDVEERTVA